MDPLQCLAGGATVLTPSSRLSRHLVHRFHARQRDAGLRSWPTPEVLPFDAFIHKLWYDWLFTSIARTAPLLLGPVQEAAVWEQIIPHFDDELLDVQRTAALAARAWSLIHEYELPIRTGNFQASADSQEFLRWVREYDQFARDNRWLDAARLPAFLLERIRQGDLEIPHSIVYAGFDEPTPIQRRFFAALNADPSASPRFEPAPRQFELAGGLEEIEAAARWSRRVLERDPSASIGVVVPDLTAQRAMVDRVFRRALDARPFAQETPAFHLSLGPALAEYPAIHAALLMLELANGPIPLARAGILLRSPFLKRAEEKASERSLFDAYLRGQGRLEVSLADLHRYLGGLDRVQIPEKQSPSAWSVSFWRLLDAAGWPGDRTLDSRSYQAFEAFRDLLSDLATLDAVLGNVAYADAFARLRRMAGETHFQPEDEGAPIQVLGTLEASGAAFDHLWITGLHDGVFPKPANPNPFLPLDLQRERRLPHSTADRELEFARTLLDRLLHSAREVTLSYPMRDGEQDLRPTPLVAGAWKPMKPESQPFSPSALDEIADNAAPPLPPDTALSGGASVLRHMAACPFRAYASVRLGARALDEPAFGLSASERGIAVHRALQLFWTETRTRDNLRALPEAELKDRLDHCAGQALVRQTGKVAHRLETIRLARLLRAWLEVERGRPPFTALLQEEPLEANLGGLRLRLRADRVDELLDGRLVVLDYKTGKINAGGWTGSRPEEPQLPLYAITLDRPLAAVAFAQVKIEQPGFAGVDEAGVFPSLAAAALDEATLLTQLGRWRSVLEKLAEDFRHGDARVDPLPKACEFCPVTPFCRIREDGSIAKDNDDAR